MGILLYHNLRIGDFDIRQHLDGCLGCLLLGHVAVNDKGLRKLPLHREHRVQEMCIRDRAKGVRERVVIYSHAWRNALLPVITSIIGWFLSIFSGSLILENVFSLNGMGKLYIDALNAKDAELCLAIQMFYTIVALVGNLITDLAYGVVDPRVRVNK